MPIYYSENPDGTQVGRYSGKSIRDGDKVKKEKQIYLGKVIDKEKLIFWKKHEGFYKFDENTLEIKSIPDADVPPLLPPLDKRLREQNVIVTFGGSYFLHELIFGVGYNDVLNVIKLKKPDTMYSLLHYYVLSEKADMHASIWYRESYAHFLYPRANMESQRISDFYVTFGSVNNRRRFFKNHIGYLKSVTDDECAIIIDSTGCQNVCRIPVTKVSKHNNEVNVECRIVLVIQRSTGLPIYFEVIPGNIVDSTTIDRIIRLMEAYGYRITNISGDAAYSCPSNIEQIILSGSDLIMRLNPTYDHYKKAIEDHKDDLLDPRFNKETDIHYQNRIVRVIKVQMAVATDENNNEVTGYVYLCRDIQAYHSKADHFMTHHVNDKMTAEEINTICESFGIFAIVATQNLDNRDAIPMFYLRQGVEQFFDFGKNYAKMMPVRNHNMNTFLGHMLMSFIATFLVIVITNRMNILDRPFVAVPKNLINDEKVFPIENDSHEQEHILEQEAMPVVYRSNTIALFFSLNFVGADVFIGDKAQTDQLIPGFIHKEANDYLKAFGIPYPRAVLIMKDTSLKLVLKPGARNTCRKTKVFSKRSILTDEEIIKLREAKQTAQQATPNAESNPENKPDIPPIEAEHKQEHPDDLSPNHSTDTANDQSSSMEKRRRGRPKGSKDKVPRKRRKKIPE